MADKALKEAQQLDKKIEASKKRAAKKRGSVAKSPAKSKSRKSTKKSAKKRPAHKKRVPRRGGGTIVKVAPDVEILLKGNRYRIVQVRDDAPAKKKPGRRKS